MPPPANPQSRCKRAGILLFVVGMLIALYGIGNFTLAYTKSPEALLQLNQQGMPGMGAQSPPISAEMLRKLALALSVAITITGLSLMMLSGPVRRANRSMLVIAMVVVGLIGGLAALFTLIAALAGLAAPPMLMMACCFSVPLAVTVWMFIWLLQAYRAAAYMEQMAAAAAGGYGQPQGNPAQHPYPPQYPQYPPTYPSPPTHPQSPPPVPPAQPGGLFGPAPFGIPPPPDETGGKYGYATKPKEKPANPDDASGADVP